MRGDPRVLRQHRSERPASDKSCLRGVVDDVMGVLSADRPADVEHHRFGHDQPTAEVEVSAHPSRVEPQPLEDLDKAGMEGKVREFAIKNCSNHGTRVTITAYLGFRDMDGLKALVDAQSTPGTTQFGHHLTPAEFRARFRPMRRY